MHPQEEGIDVGFTVGVIPMEEGTYIVRSSFSSDGCFILNLWKRDENTIEATQEDYLF